MLGQVFEKWAKKLQDICKKMISERIQRFKLPVALSLLGVVLIIGGVFTSDLTKKPKNFPKESLVETEKIISVDVSGEVNKPGVYQVKEGSRIEEAIKAAGGFTQQANQEYISKYLNLAQRLSDGSKVYVPAEGEQASTPQVGAVAGVSTQVKVNINTSSQIEIEGLPGVGPTTALKIISARPFQQIEDLLNKKVVSKSVYEKIKDSLVLY